MLNYIKINAVLTHSIFNHSKTNLNFSLKSNVTNATCCAWYYIQNQVILSKTSKMQNGFLTNKFQILSFANLYFIIFKLWDVATCILVITYSMLIFTCLQGWERKHISQQKARVIGRQEMTEDTRSNAVKIGYAHVGK